jgi:hypothetical protein
MLLWSEDFWDAQESVYIKREHGLENIFLTTSHDSLKSGFIGPFGGPKPQINQIDLEGIRELIQQSISTAKSCSKKYFEIRLPPRDFYPEFLEGLEVVLFELGFRTKYLDTNSSLRIANFSEIPINRNRRRDLKFWSQENAVYSFENTSLESAYECIAENRKIRNLSPSLGLNQLAKLRNALGERFGVHGVIYNTEVISSAITLQIDQNIQYVFMWGDRPKTRMNYPSPITFLLQGMTQKFTLGSPTRICLGTSSQNGIIDASLLQFKNSLGFGVAYKPTYIIDI